MREVLDRLGGVDQSWIESTPPVGLADRVVAVAGAEEAHRDAPPARVDRAPRNSRVLLTAAAACVVGVLGTITYQGMADRPVEGPPGTFGAVEEIDFTGEPEGSRVNASLVAHTWGTETVLELDGLEIGETFEVVLVSATGAQIPSGTFIGAEATVLCRMNAAVLREDVVQVRIVSADESVNLVAELPAVSS